MIKDPRAYLQHMRDCALTLVEYTQKHTYSQYLEEPWDQAASVRNLEIIGEAANKVTKDFHLQHAQIPWRDIIDFRNVAIHDYIDLDAKMVWNVMTIDVPELLKKLNEILTKKTS